MNTRPDFSTATAPASPEPRRQAPGFRTFTVMGERGKPDYLAFWCPYCEGLHSHGAAGGGGNRAPHCDDDRHSPLICTGYNLDVVDDAGSDADVLPPGLLVGTQRLHRVMYQASGALRAVLLRYVLGIKSVRGAVLQKRTDKGSAWIFGAESWLIDENGWEPVEGQGFLRLAAKLYGVPPGIVALRFLEALSLDTLDAQAARELQAVIDAWVARGAPSRASR